MKGSIIISTADKGGSRGNASQMATYALSKGKNEQTEIMDIRGTLATDPRGAFAEMEAIAKATRCENYLYHFQINPSHITHLTPEQFKKAIAETERALGLEGSQHVVWRHVKEGREHYHVCCNRVMENERGQLRAVHMGHEATKRQHVAIKLEKMFRLEGIENRPLVNYQREERALPSWEYRQADSHGLDLRKMKADVRELRELSDNGQAFAAALSEYGYILGRGDSRDFVVIDQAGGVHSLARFAGMKVEALREYMADVDQAKLPTVSQVREADREGVAYHHTPQVPNSKTAAAIFESFQTTKNAGAFAAACTAKGVILACVTLAEARESAEARERAEAEGLQRLPLKLDQGEIVAVNEYGSVYRLNERTTGAAPEQIEARSRELERSGKLPNLHEATAKARQASDIKGAKKEAERNAKYAEQRRQREDQKERQQHPVKAFVRDMVTPKPAPAIAQQMKEAAKATTAPKLEPAAAIAQQQPAPVVERKAAPKVQDQKPEQKQPPKLAGRIMGGAAAVVEEVLGLLDFFAPSPAPREISWAEYSRSVEAQQEHHAQAAAKARQEQALDNIRQDWESGRGIAREDLKNLGRDQLEAIKAHGIDDALKLLIEDEQSLSRGRHRQR